MADTSFLPHKAVYSLEDAQENFEAIEGKVGALGSTLSTSNISTTETLTSAAYATLTTPDQVTGIVLATNGLIAVWYQAMWQESVAGAGRAAIFIGSNQLQVQSIVAHAPATQAAATSATTAAVDVPLFSFAGGLASVNAASGSTADVTTGQVVGIARGTTTGTPAEEIGGTVGQLPTSSSIGGPCYIQGLAAGTYTISVQFKATSGSVTAKNRKLWVRTA